MKSAIPSKEGMARVTGLEPATSGVTGRHSNQLSYTRVFPRREAVRRGEGRRLGGAPRVVKRDRKGNYPRSSRHGFEVRRDGRPQSIPDRACRAEGERCLASIDGLAIY